MTLDSPLMNDIGPFYVLGPNFIHERSVQSERSGQINGETETLPHSAPLEGIQGFIWTPWILNFITKELSLELKKCEIEAL